MSSQNFVDDVPKTYSEAINSENKIKWIEATNSEIKSLSDNGTCTLVNTPDVRKPVFRGWVFKIMYDNHNEPVKFKARLVANGYSQVYGIDYNETYAPVANMVTIRTLFSIVDNKNVFMYQMDIKIAFLNGWLKELINMQQPEGYKSRGDRVCQLHCSLYGLKQSSKCWNTRFNDFMIKQKFNRCKLIKLYVRQK